MNKKRLLKLATLLEADAKNKKGIQFDLGSWGRAYDHKSPVSCGTTACAMGLAAISGAFKREGMAGVINRDNEIRFRWKGRAIHPINAAKKLFGISHEETCSLFVYTDGLTRTTGAAGERAVAKRIRDFVIGKFNP